MSFYPQGRCEGVGNMGVGTQTTQKHKRLFPWKDREGTARTRWRFPLQWSGDASKGERRPRPLRDPSLATRRVSGPDAPAWATHRPQCWPTGRSTVERAPARAAAARKSSLVQPRSRRAEKRNMESKHRRRNTAGRLAFFLVWLTRPYYNAVWKDKWQMRGPSCRAFIPL